MKLFRYYCIMSMFLTVMHLSAQKTEDTSVDASKPTNLYTQINGAFESQSLKNGTHLFGTRINIQYAFNPDNLLLIEVPLLYNDNSKSFGISDTRVRYFHVVKRNITSRFIAIAPFADVTIPSGSFNNGLGSNIWSITAGLVAGYVVSPKISMFPGIGYVHITDPNKYVGSSQNGFNVQTNMSISFTKRAFLFVNPILTLLSKTIWTGELNFNYMITPDKLKINFGYFPNFTNDINTFRIGTTLFL